MRPLRSPFDGAELALPWSEREARMIGQREKDATVLVRADATESQVKKLLATAGVVHLATHGELSEDDPLSSAMLLVPGGGEDGRLEGTGPVEALRQAQVETMRGFPHPYAWAAFGLSGLPR